MPYGYRLWVEGRSALHLRERLNSEYAVGNLVTEVIEKAGMRVAGGPFTYKEPPREVGKGPGVTAVAILIESSVHIHTYPEKDYYFFELFSCKHFQHAVILDALCEFMACSDFNSEFMPVGDDFPDEENGDYATWPPS